MSGKNGADISVSAAFYDELQGASERYGLSIAQLVEHAVNKALDREEKLPIVWGRTSPRAPYHRMTGIDHGPQTMKCGERIHVRDVYHIDTRDGWRTPLIGTVCQACAVRRGP